MRFEACCVAALVLSTACVEINTRTTPHPDASAPTSDAGPQGGSDAGTGAGGVDAGAPRDGGTAASGAWSMGNYASWQAGSYPVAEVDWSGLTHVAISFYIPHPDGTLSLLGANPAVMKDLVDAAHAHGVKAIASLGGSDTGPDFHAATAAVMSTFVANIAAIVSAGSYDGVDVDWEPMEFADEPVAIDLAKKIRVACPGALVTITIGYQNVNVPADLSHFAAIAAEYDQLNMMSYGMAGAWQGWKSWHCSPLYQQDSATPTSIDSSVALYLAAGVPSQKLGIGIGFYGLCYSPPVTAPDQDLGIATILASDGTMSFANIMGSYYDAGARHWDSFARVPYLSFASAHAPDGCTFISYDDDQSIAEKGAYLKAKGLGGVIEWEINEGYIASAPVGQKNPLLAAIRDHILH